MSYLKKLLFLGAGLISVSALAVPFWKAEREGKHLYMLGTVITDVSLSDIQCHEIIENKLKESGLVFLEDYYSKEDSNLPLQLSFEDQKKLFIGSKQEKDEIMKPLSEETKKKMQNRINISDLVRTNILKSGYPHYKREKQGQFEDLDKNSQDFLKHYGLYNKDKFFYDYFFDIILMAWTDAYIEVYGSDLRKQALLYAVLDMEIENLLPVENDILVRSLDDNEKILRDLKEKTKQPEKDEAGIKQEITAEHINEAINKYYETRASMIKYYIQDKIATQELIQALPSHYNQENWSYFYEFNDTYKNDALLKNRNELWVEKILSSLENEDKAFIEHKPLFMSAGALHFVGSDNVLDRLKGEGFKITKINEESCQF